MIPRGGHCRSCNQYTLWGDTIRGCHRRRPSGAGAQSEEDDGVEGDGDVGEIFAGEESDSISSVDGGLSFPDETKNRGIKSATMIKKKTSAQIPGKLSTARSKSNPEPFSERITKTTKEPRLSTRQVSAQKSSSGTTLRSIPERRRKKIVKGSKSLHTSTVNHSREFPDLDIVSSHRCSEPLSRNDGYTSQVLGYQGCAVPTPERRSPARYTFASRKPFGLGEPDIPEFNEDEKFNRSSSVNSVELEQEFLRGVNIPSGLMGISYQRSKNSNPVVVSSHASSPPLEYEMSVLSISSPTHSPRLSQHPSRNGDLSDNCEVIVLSD